MGAKGVRREEWKEEVETRLRRQRYSEEIDA